MSCVDSFFLGIKGHECEGIEQLRGIKVHISGLAAMLLETSEVGQKQSDLDFWRTNESPECPAASDLLLHGSAGEIVLWSQGGEKNKFGKFGGGSEADSPGTLIGFSARGGEKQSRRSASAAD